jgi:hypothetical protein
VISNVIALMNEIELSEEFNFGANFLSWVLPAGSCWKLFICRRSHLGSDKTRKNGTFWNTSSDVGSH